LRPSDRATAKRSSSCPETGWSTERIEFAGVPRTLADVTPMRTAAALDFRFLCANDHLRFGRPWLDGPTALAAALEASAPAAS
jgi:hypothetical protein